MKKPALLGLTLCVAQALAAGEPGTPCLIEPALKIALKSAVTATIVAVNADRGALVRRGQVLVTLDASVERASLAAARFRSVMEGPARSAEARLAHSRDKLRRREELRQLSFVSAQDRDDSQAEFRIAEAALAEARDNRELARLEAQRWAAETDRRTITSPINGVVIERLQHPGELAQAGDAGGPILRLAQTDPARVEVVLPAARFNRVKVGDIVDVRPEPPFIGSYKATVRVVDRVVDSASGTFGVRLEFPNPAGDVPLGVRCVAQM